MFFNELILFTHIIVIAITTFIALRLGQSALVAFSVVQMLLANIFVLKQTTLFGLHATCADAFIIGSLLSFNLLNELYGASVARRTIPTTFVIALFYAAMSHIHLAYIPSIFDTTQEHFKSLFSVAPWIVIGSIGVFCLVQVIDFALYRLFKRLWPHYLLVLRNLFSLSISQLVDTVAFTLILYGLGVLTNVLQVVVISYSIKMVVIALSTPLIAAMLWLHRWLDGGKRPKN